ncbi:DUF1080 domain-containing protein [Mariniflexile soesokkakense]|uniref:DUF1080 domain-containing protein n=1 Tax=Mariniflexile soesokkakense TaxID=1343160 RepID=A0ABV0AAA5_9FLAO
MNTEGIRMKKIFYSGLFCILLYSFPSFKISAQQTDNELQDRDIKNDDGFVYIFDGKTLEHWEGDPVYWRVENGNLVGEITPETILKTNSFIIWQGGQPHDFELMLEYRISAVGNSGINYRSERLTDVPFALRGYQADIDGRNRYTGQNYEERKRTTLAYRGEKVRIENIEKVVDLKSNIENNCWQIRDVIDSLGQINSLKLKIKDNDWNQVHLVVKGNRLLHYVNNVLMSDVTDNDSINQTFSGYLGVQVHTGPPMKVEYRNIKLKNL